MMTKKSNKNYLGHWKKNLLKKTIFIFRVPQTFFAYNFIAKFSLIFCDMFFKIKIGCSHFDNMTFIMSFLII